MLVIATNDTDSSRLIGIDKWLANDSFANIMFTGDNKTFSFAEVWDKAELR